jgi:DHA1 family arabinose polymer transporter-like MFS transporter
VSKKSLISLSFGSFAIGMTEFTMMGVLPDVAQSIGADIPTAGNFISLYALGVVIGAPLLVLFSTKYPQKQVLLFLMGLFVVFNGLFTLMPSYELMIFTRFLAGLPHGAFFGVATVVGAGLAEKGKEAQAISIIFTGMTIANLLGVPLGTYIGHHFSWRFTYIAITLCGVVTMWAIKQWLPVIAHTTKGFLFHQLNYFKTGKAWVIILMVSIGTGGMFAWMSYIAPLMTDVAHLPADRVPYIMILVGLGMVVGNIVGGKIADNMTPIYALMISLAVMGTCLAIVFFTTHLGGWLCYFMTFITGAAAFCIGSPIQIILIQSAKGAETMAAAGGQASFNIGNTLGAYLGGLPIVYGLGYEYASFVGICLASSGMIIAFCYWYFYVRTIAPTGNTPTHEGVLIRE